jgi:predicted outer membrane lipoprotein
MASRRSPRQIIEPQLAERRDHWRRWIVIAQGAYYMLSGLWPLVHFSSFAQIVALRINPFQAQSFGALLIVIGASLLEASRRQPPGAFPTLLGVAVAAAIAVINLVWLPRLAVRSGLWIDVLIEVAIASALILLYPRSQSERPRTTKRRRRI